MDIGYLKLVLFEIMNIIFFGTPSFVVPIAKVISEKPDMILLDIMMPKLDGLGFLKKFQENKDEFTQIPVLVTSSMSQLGPISQAASLGIKGYILKSTETLDTIINNVDLLLETKTPKK